MTKLLSLWSRFTGHHAKTKDLHPIHPIANSAIHLLHLWVEIRRQYIKLYRLRNGNVS